MIKDQGMRQITFTITEEEIKEVCEREEISNQKLNDKQIQSILTIVECDGVLAEDIQNSIISAIKQELSKDLN